MDNRDSFVEQEVVGDAVIDQGSAGNIQNPDEPLIKKETKEATYGSIVGFSISLNYVIGTGVFGLPFAFYSGGITMTTISLLVFTFFLSLTAFWVLEIMARATGALKAKEENSAVPENELSYKKIDFTLFCELFSGKIGKIGCQIVMALYVYGAMWAYVGAFASTAAMLIFEFFVSDQTCDIYNNPSVECNWTYRGFVFVYLCIVLPLTLMELSEQKVLQVILTIYRFVAFAVMLITVIIGYAVSGPFVPPNGADPTIEDSGDFWGFKLAGFTTMFTATAFALTVHYNLPNSLSPVNNKKTLKGIVFGVISTAVSFYWLVGAICAMFFREYTNPLVVLNWQGYTGLEGGWGKGKTLPIAVIVELVILLFPIINLANDFPLVAITLSSNLDRFVPAKYLETAKSKKIARIVVRLCAVFPPIIAGFFLGKLDIIFTFAGVFAFILVFIIPCLFQLLSSKYMIDNYGPGSDWTPYTSKVLSNKILVYIVFAIGAVAFVYALVSAFLSAFGVNIFA